MSEIAHQFRDSRSSRGWSQTDLAERAAVSRPSIARIEAGEDVSTATLLKVAGALGLTLHLAPLDDQTECE